MAKVTDTPAQTPVKKVKSFKFIFGDENSAKEFIKKANSKEHVDYAQHPCAYYHKEDSKKTEVLVTSSTGSVLYDTLLLHYLSDEAEKLGGVLMYT